MIEYKALCGRKGFSHFDMPTVQLSVFIASSFGHGAVLIAKRKVFVNINLASLEIIFGSVVRHFSLQMPHTDALLQI